MSVLIPTEPGAQSVAGLLKKAPVFIGMGTALAAIVFIHKVSAVIISVACMRALVLEIALLAILLVPLARLVIISVAKTILVMITAKLAPAIACAKAARLAFIAVAVPVAAVEVAIGWSAGRAFAKSKAAVVLVVVLLLAAIPNALVLVVVAYIGSGAIVVIPVLTAALMFPVVIAPHVGDATTGEVPVAIIAAAGWYRSVGRPAVAVAAIV